jgi:zinc protease
MEGVIMRIFSLVFCVLLSSALILLFITDAIQAEVKEYTLANGLKVLVLDDHKAPLATFQIWYRVGSRDEPSGKSGLSHLLEHMMFKGTPRYGSKQFSKIIQRNGGMDNAHTARDYTMYFQTLSSDRIGISIDLEADRMSNLLLDPGETLSERNVVMEERRMRREDDPRNALFEAFSAAAFMAHPYRKPVIGWMSDIASLQREDLSLHYRNYYTPNNAFIVIAGDLNPEEVLKKVVLAFGDKKGTDIGVKHVTEEPQQRGERRVRLEKEAELPYILVGFHTPGFPHGDSMALEVLGAILSGGKSSRLYRSLVYEKKLVLNAGADYSGMYKDPFLFMLWGTAAPGREIGDVERSLYEEIEQIKDIPPSEREVQKAKNLIEASFIFSQDSLYMQAMKIGMFELLGDWRLVERYLEGIRKVTPEDVQKAAKKYLNEDNRTVGTLVPVRNPK